MLFAVALLPQQSQTVPLSSTRTRHELVDSLERLQVLQTSLKAVDDPDWRRDRRQSEPTNWLGTHVAGTAWDAYERMLREQQSGIAQQPRRTSNPVNFIGKRVIAGTLSE